MSAAPDPIRFGVLGCGVIAYWTHLRELPHVRRARLVAAADPDPAARQRATRLARIPVCERSEELLLRSDIDAVVICAPTNLHAELAIAAARAGKHFYLEKPIAIAADEARRVVQAATQAGITGAVGFNRRCHPVYEQARDLLRAGRIGPVRGVLTAFCEPVSRAAMPEWKCRRSTGGGVLLDLASHHVDLVRWLLDDNLARVEARLASESTEDDQAWLDLTTVGGIEVKSFFSFRAGRADFLEFLGQHGTLRVDRHRPSLSLRLGRRFGYGVRSALLFPARDAIVWRLTRVLRPSYEPSYRRSLTAFVAMLGGAAPRIATLDDGVRSLEAILAAEESARLGRPVDVGMAI
jgi:myo-inositol 2-dehydrogenase / D-chiro-inositol 1-dehydrogenase